MKRLLDVLLSLIGLAVTLPVTIFVALVIRMTSWREPVLFRQARVGLNGRSFTILKFRSMSSDSSGGLLLVTAGSDPRITRIGRTLRSTKVDELPQLINVLRGEMSLVGPRPEVPKYVALWSDVERDIILSVRPGITDPASVLFRREEELLAAQDDPESYYVASVLPAKAKVYVDYVRTRSLLGDIRIVLGTIRSVVSA